MLFDSWYASTEYWATNDLSMAETVRRHGAEVGFAIENYHRELKQLCGVERCQVRVGRTQRNHIGLALRAFCGENSIVSPSGPVCSKPG